MIDLLARDPIASTAADTFLRHGRLRLFEVPAGDGPAGSSLLMAAIDARQTSAGRQVGTIGLTGAIGSPASMRAAIAAAEGWLADAGARVVRFPVRLTTWHGHRLVTEGHPSMGGPPTFPLEPVNPPSLLHMAEELGYRVVHRAASYAVRGADYVRVFGFAERRLAGARLVDRPLDVGRLDHELAAIHHIASQAFAGSWGFSPISRTELASIYRPLAELAQPELVRILERPSGEPVGFFFAFADPRAPAGSSGARFVAKTLAVLPEFARRSPGAGVGLCVAAHRRALELGYPTAVHALLADGSLTQRMAARIGARFRRYATLEKVVSR